MVSKKSDTEFGGIRLQIFLYIRWIAIVGQTMALCFVEFYLKFEFSIFPALALVATSALLNILLFLNYRRNTRLSDDGAALCLFYDILQLAGLLFLTGGLQNPFSILLLVPVTISATHLSSKSSIMLGGSTLIGVTILAFYHKPLPLPEGSLQFSEIYLVAIWAALMLSTLFLSAYAWLVASDNRRVMEALSAMRLALAREQQLSAVGGIAAAAAHELGTPLNTILLIAKDLEADMDADNPLFEDISLLNDQAQKCRQVLTQISKKTSLQDGLDLHGEHFGFLPLPDIFTMIVEKQDNCGKQINIITAGNSNMPPIISPTAEFIHGLGNFISNAIEFSNTRVSINLDWTEHTILAEISDDGPGFATDILDLIGEPYNSSRSGKGGMGLGIFIAKTLLGRTGAEISFENLKQGGAKVKIVWPRTQLENRMPSDQ
jgi:two-component system, sensor histidine kinase RegB